MARLVVSNVLSSDVSWKILELLVANELSELEICTSLGIKPALVRLHLERFAGTGIVAARKRARSSGGSMTVYGLTNIDDLPRFPIRDYSYLSEALITGLRRSLGEDGATVILRDIGIRLGEDVAQALHSRTRPPNWGPRAYGEHFVKGLLAEMLSHPKIIKIGNRRLIYELLNCPFVALADKYPMLVCDVLDRAFYEGIDKKLKEMRTTRLECKSHGDPTCKFSVEWPKGKAA